MYNNQNEPAVFVSGELKQSKDGSHYVWSKTVDLAEIARELNSSVITITLVKPRKPRSEAERTFIFKAADPKYLARNNGMGKPANGRAQQQTPQNDLLI